MTSAYNQGVEREDKGFPKVKEKVIEEKQYLEREKYLHVTQENL